MNSESVRLPHFNLELTCGAVSYALQLTPSPFLHIPTEDGDLSIQVLLNMGHDPSMQNLALRRACYMKDAAMVKRLLSDPRVFPASPEEHLIQSVTPLTDITILHMLLKDGRIDPGDNNSMALYLACACDNLPAVVLLLDDGRVDMLRCDGFRVACGLGHTRVLSLYLSDERMRSPEGLKVISAGLEYACISGREEIVALLLDDGRAQLSVENCSGIALGILPERRRAIAIVLLTSDQTAAAGEYLLKCT